MKEVEVKAKLTDREAVMAKLKALGCVFGPATTQRDAVYAEKVDSLEVFRGNKVFLRIRVVDDSKILFTLKKQMANDLDAIEHEAEVSSKEEMEQALLLMGYKEMIRVNKSRVTTHYNGCEICIDDVEGLGVFIEMEKLTEEGNSEEIQAELFEFLKSLGIKSEDRVFSGYDILALEKLENQSA